MVWEQYRRVSVGDVEITDLDMNISVSYSQDKGLEYDVTFFNLAPSTWGSMETGTRVRIMLGWGDGEQRSVCDGTIKKRNKNIKENDIAFRIQGQDKSNELVKFNTTRSWTNQPPDRIASDIGSLIGLSNGEIESVGSNISGEWTMQQDKPVRYWLDQLVNEAQDMTSYAWEWFVQAGQLHFVKKDGRKDDAVVLSYDNTLISLGPAESEGDTDEQGLEFEAMCEPKIREGGSVLVQTEDHSGLHKVTSYTFESSSVNGDHMVRGKLSPLDVEYTINYI